MDGKQYKTAAEWLAEGERLFGPDYTKWRFKCPHCGRVTTGQEFKDAGADTDDIYNNCIGRFDKSKGCDWAAYGLFDICNTHVEGQPVFDFAPYEDEEGKA